MSSFEFRGVQRIASTYYRPVTQLNPPLPVDGLRDGHHGANLHRIDTRVYPIHMSRATGRTSAPRQPIPNYRPLPLRRSFLGALILIILGILATVIAGYRLLPPEVDRTLVPGSEDTADRPKENIDSVSRTHPRLIRQALGPINASETVAISITSLARESSLTSTNSPSRSPPGKEALPVETGATAPTGKNVPSSTDNPIPSLPIQSGLPNVSPRPTTTGRIGDPDEWATEGEWTISSSVISFDNPFIGSAGDFASDGKWTETITLSNGKIAEPTTSSFGFGPPGHHAQDGLIPVTESWDPVALTPTETSMKKQTVTQVAVETVSQVVLPVTRLTTFDKVVSQATRTTTVQGGLTTVVDPTTLSGVVESVVEETTSAVVKSFTSVETVTFDGADGVVYVLPQISTLVDSDGVPTSTITRTPSVRVSTPTVIIETDSNGIATGIITTSVLAGPMATTLTNSKGVPTLTATGYPTSPTDQPRPETVIKVYSISKGQYFVGFFLPPLLSGLLSIPIRMIDLSAKQLQPWHELTRAQGASASESLCLKTDGFYGLLTAVRVLGRGQPLILLTSILTICSLLLVPLSAESIAPKLHGSCSTSNFRGCAMTLGIFLGPAKAMIGVLVLIVVLLLLVLLFLRRWQSGVPANPWTLAGVASLSTNKDVRALFSSLPTGRKGERVERSQLVKALEGRTFKLGYFINHHGIPEYGINIYQASEARPRLIKSATSLSTSSDSGPDGQRVPPRPNPNSEKHHLPFLMLSFTSRISFLLLITGVMVVTLYYNNTGGDTAFERFMGRQSLGVRAMFTAIGVAITLFWCSFFTG